MVRGLVTRTSSRAPGLSFALRTNFVSFTWALARLTLTVRLGGHPRPLQVMRIVVPDGGFLTTSLVTTVWLENVAKKELIVARISGNSASLPSQFSSILLPGMSRSPGRIAGLLSLQSAGGEIPSLSLSRPLVPGGVVNVPSAPAAGPPAQRGADVDRADARRKVARRCDRAVGGRRAVVDDDACRSTAGIGLAG